MTVDNVFSFLDGTSHFRCFVHSRWHWPVAAVLTRFLHTVLLVDCCFMYRLLLLLLLLLLLVLVLFYPDDGWSSPPHHYHCRSLCGSVSRFPLFVLVAFSRSLSFFEFRVFPPSVCPLEEGALTSTIR